MNGFTADDADDFFAIAVEDLDALAEHDLVPPATNGDELEVAVRSDVLNHEADLVHVACDHDAWTIVGMRADDGAGFVGVERADFLEFVGENGADFVFES